MSAKLITKNTAKKYIAISEAIAEVVAEWADYNCVATLIDATELRSGKLAKSTTLYNLVADGEPTEIDYGFYRYDNGDVRIEAQHTME